MSNFNDPELMDTQRQLGNEQTNAHQLREDRNAAWDFIKERGLWREFTMPGLESKPLNPLERLWNSTADLYRRFDLDAPMVDRVIKFHEETHEFLQEALKTTGENGALVVEGWDVIVTVIGILQKSGIDFDRFCEYEQVVSYKNNAKNHETHVVHNGLITRKDKINANS